MLDCLSKNFIFECDRLNILFLQWLRLILSTSVFLLIVFKLMFLPLKDFSDTSEVDGITVQPSSIQYEYIVSQFRNETS